MPSDTQDADFRQEHDTPGAASGCASGASTQNSVTGTNPDAVIFPEAKLHQEDRELSRIVDLIAQTIVVLNPEGKAIYANRMALVWLKVFFTDSEESQAAGGAFLKRYLSRTENRDAPISDKVVPAQIAAVGNWGRTLENVCVLERD
jgi:hypothetical protein